MNNNEENISLETKLFEVPSFSVTMINYNKTTKDMKDQRFEVPSFFGTMEEYKKHYKECEQRYFESGKNYEVPFELIWCQEYTQNISTN